MAGFRVVLDANVLFPIVQVDLLMHLAHQRTYVPLWSSQILDEVVKALVETGRTTEERALRRTSRMNESFPDAQVHNWEELVKGIRGIPDANDKHVVAAAIEGNASAIVTNNLKDFPDEALSLHGLHAKSCDEFLLDLYDLYPVAFEIAFEQMRKTRKKPPVSVDDLVSALAGSCPGFVATYREKQ
ncbi:PIN domain-containing protein [uncultured Actinomyces sp.]|uniref:PIN domain-containing protein n=1 Tax=uncultured Actinomyces sp. TaxID=249061 RepID=UPI002889EAD8|nr:PIN domain-containing protein [uncultured Actinomyces sp.]